YFPGATQAANIVANSALIAPSLGRALAAGANATVVVDVLPSQRQFEDSSSQTDIRFIKMFKLGGTRRVQGIFDIYNAFNARPVLAVTTRYTGTTGGAWLRSEEHTSELQSR